MKIKNDVIMQAVAVSNETEYSDAIDISSMAGYAIELVYTGSSLNGSAKLQFSFDNGTTWRDLPDTGDTEAHDLSASGGSHMWNVKDAFYPRVRLAVTTADANTATCNARIFAKGV